MKDACNKQDEGRGAAGPCSTSTGLLEAVKAGDADAWRRLAALYGPLVHAWCCRKGLQQSDAEDVVQEVFLTISDKLGAFRRWPSGTFRGWLWTVTRHKLGDWIRRHRRAEQTLDSSAGRALAAPADEPSDPADAREVTALYRRALELIQAEFEERTWHAFWRVAIDGQPAGEVATELGMTRNAVYVAKSRVLRRLHETLGDG